VRGQRANERRFKRLSRRTTGADRYSFFSRQAKLRSVAMLNIPLSPAIFNYARIYVRLNFLLF
jgi:hypothetical protein